MSTAVILAAGNGKKLWPFSDYWPKAAIPVAGTANIVRLVESLQASNMDNIYVVAGHLEQRIRHVLRNTDGVNVISGSHAMGTASALEHVTGQLTDDQVTVVYGDIYAPPSVLQSFIQSSRNPEHALGLLLAKPILEARSQDFICADVDGCGVVKQIYGHPRPHYVNHQLMGIYSLPTALMRKYLKVNPGLMLSVNVGAMPPLESQLEQSLQMMIEDGHKLFIHPCHSEVVDIDKPWHIMDACKAALEHDVLPLTASVVPDSCSIDPSAYIKGHVILGENVTIGRNVSIQGNVVIQSGTVIDNGAVIGANTWIGSNCKIEDFCKIGPYSSIGNNNRIGHCAEFSGVTFDRVSFTHYGEVYGVVGESTDIAAGVTVGILRFDDLGQSQRIEGRLEQPTQFSNAVYIGDFTRTGISSLYMPGVKIGSNCVIGSGVMVESDVASKSLLYLEQQVIRKEWTSSRYGW